MKIVTVSNRKGGVGKSSTSLSLAYGLAQNGQRVLLIDLESQGNTTLAILGQANNLPRTALDIFKGTPIKETIIRTDKGFDFIAGCEKLENAAKMFTDVEEMYILKTQLEELRNADEYDYCVIDTPPSLQFVTLSALAATDECIVPVNPDMFSEQGTIDMGRAIGTVRNYLQNPNLKVAGILITRYKSNSTFAQQKADEIKMYAKSLDTKIYKTKIRECVYVSESQANMTDVYSYKKGAKNNAREDYAGFLEEFMKDEKIKPKKQSTSKGKNKK